ncbi:MAG: hypothetical protein P9F75_03650 [Candidatus Contendobacter sp.]|nr:hypothetical protein [Candidatus Contendobacter sp.]
MTRIPRRVRKIPDPKSGLVENPIENLDGFRTDVAWVLLGEPGAGKTTAFQMEAEATGGHYLRIEEFIHLDIEPEWQEKTLFLDGFDEVRAGSSGDSILLRLRQRLKRLGNLPFRIACRAADWYGSTDRADIEAAAPDGRITVLLLEPLNREDILRILRENHGILDPQAFVHEAEKFGIADLLDNPQTLELLVAAVSGGQWPKTRDETYQLACEKLATEANRRHRDKKRDVLLSAEKVLDAAGQLCTVLLFSDKTGIALDRESATERFPELADYIPPENEAARQAIGSKLFRPEGEERVIPSHRSIAEYLAARWLGRRIDRERLPLKRVLNLLLGADGGVVAGLRGLFGWLALHCLSARTCLIDADPLTVIVYGDVKPMAVAAKRRILAGLRREAERYPAFRQDGWMTAHLFGALADVELRDDFLSILQAPERNIASQVLADCVLDILAYGEGQPEFASVVLDIVRDDSRWPVLRKDALKAWLKLSANPKEALNLLDDVNRGHVTDSDDELAGVLLRHLYPTHLDPKTLLRHLHKPKKPNLLGSYVSFWQYQLPRETLSEHLPIVLDGLVDHPELKSCNPHEYHLEQIANTLLVQGIVSYGDLVADDRLFTWLGIGSDEHGYFERLKTEHQTIADWLSARPERYKSLLALCFKQCEQHEHPLNCVYSQLMRLHGATPPEDIGLWHFTQVDLTDKDTLAKEHLGQAVRTLIDGHSSCGLSLDLLEAWAITHPERKQWLDSLLVSEVPNLRTRQAKREIIQKQKYSKIKRKNTIDLSPYLSEIRFGTAPTNLMHHLASVWKGHFYDISGENTIERFNNFCENGSEILDAAEAGFRLCPACAALPTVEEIIDLCLKQREHVIRLPCLIGMELRWQDGSEGIESLPEEALRKMIAFRLTYGFESTPDWFVYLVQWRADLVAEVLIAYASVALRAGKEHIDSIHPLADDPKYRTVAALAASSLLESFPLSAQTGQLYYLKSLLKTALRYTPEILQSLIGKKLGMKDMDIAQQIYWRAAAMLLDPTQNEATLWDCVGESEVHIKHLAEFVSNSGDFNLPVKTIGRLIEKIAPHAELDWQINGGASDITDARQRGDIVRGFINRLGAMPTSDAAQEIERLLAQPNLEKLKWLLESARHQQKIHQRESQFRFLSPREVAQVLANQAPTSVADLAALTLDHLDGIARELRQENDDGFRAFWNVEKKRPTSQREENLCRDALLTRLRARLHPLGIECQPEGDYANDKRADIRLSYRNEFELPIEIKRDSNESLWTALRNQLIDQYAIAPRANRHGIYLVLWFSGKGMPCATGGKNKPRSPQELQARLEAQLSSVERQRIFVRVLDVSWPTREAISGR